MKNQEISTLIGQKRAYNSSSFLLYVGKNDQQINKIDDKLDTKKGKSTQKKTRNIAILASKKNFKTAVVRNKVRRMVKNAINKVILDLVDENKEQLRDKKAYFSTFNLIFSLKKGFEKLDFDDLVREIQQSLSKNAII